MIGMDLRKHAMDSLVRTIAAEFPQGWNLEAGSAARRARVWMRWHTVHATLVQPADSADMEERLKRVWVALKAAEPPCGWQPKCGADPIIRAAFADAWPEE